MVFLEACAAVPGSQRGRGLAVAASLLAWVSRSSHCPERGRAQRSSGLAGATSAKGVTGRRGQKLVENNYGPD